MKKTFQTTHEKIQPARLIEAVKHETRKYIRRERNKALPAGVDFCDFSCAFGADSSQAKAIHIAELDKHIEQAFAAELPSFYVEILARPGYRQAKPNTMMDADDGYDDDFDFDTQTD